MRRKNNNLLVILFLLFVLSIGIGYAYLSSNLTINGSTNVVGNTWDVHFANLQVSSGSVEATTEAAIDTNDNTLINYSVNLEKPGDFYEFTVDVVNGGSIDGMIDAITSNISINNAPLIAITTETLPSYLDFSLTYSDGTAIIPNHKLDAGTQEKYKVRVEFKEDISENDLPSSSQNLNISITANYKQKNSSAIDCLSIVPTIDSCPNCVFAYYEVDEIKDYGENGGILTNYTRDYRLLKENNEQLVYFLGHVIDNNGKILRGFTCGIVNIGETNEKAFCLEGSHGGETYNSNKTLLQGMESYFSEGCEEEEDNFHCTGDINVIISTNNYIIPSFYFISRVNGTKTGGCATHGGGMVCSDDFE